MQKRIAIFNDTSVSQHFGCTAVMISLTKALEQRNVQIAYRWPVAVDWQFFAAELKSISIDAIIVNGEGSIHHSLERARARQLCALGPYAKEHLGVPAFLLNASIQDLEETEIENLRSFQMISVRESRSQAYLASFGIKSTVAGDLSFSTAQPNQRSRTGLLVTDSVYMSVSKELANFANTNNTSFTPMRSKHTIISRLKRKLIGSPSPPLYERINPSLEEELTKFLNEICGAELVVTGRFHSVCLSLLAQTPILAVPSNTDKISAILEDALGNTDRLISIDDLARLKPKSHSYEWKNEELYHLDRYLSETKVKQEAIFDEVCEYN